MPGNEKTAAFQACGSRKLVMRESLFGSGGASFADEAIHGFGRLSAYGEPFVSFFEVDLVVGAFEEWIVGADLLDVTSVAALAAVNGDDFVIRAILCAFAVETERD